MATINLDELSYWQSMVAVGNINHLMVDKYLKIKLLETVLNWEDEMFLSIEFDKTAI